MRRFAKGVSTSDKAKLRVLVNHRTGPIEYRQAMYELGVVLGVRIAKRAAHKRRALLICTAEDADYLAKGIFGTLGNSVCELNLACLWNFRTHPRTAHNLNIDLDVAPIIKRYEEPTPKSLDFVVVAKSVISTACVVRHNLLDLLERKQPAQVFIAAPVIYKGAARSLKTDFPSKISQKFRFVYLAVDDYRDENGMLRPGIGGDVYTRLGLSRLLRAGRMLIPHLVKQRRASYLQTSR
jgi:hypothetical protein